MSKTESLASIHRVVWAALMAALVAVGAYLQFPLGPVPFSMQPFFLYLTGFVLGARWGALSVCLYLAAGVAGLPVFTGGSAGLAHFFGPTGGFLLGFPAMAWCCGMSVKSPGRGPSSWLVGVLWGLVGMAVMYALGLWRMVAVIPSMTWAGGVAAMAVFMALDAVKLAAAVAAARLLSRSRLSPS